MLPGGSQGSRARAPVAWRGREAAGWCVCRCRTGALGCVASEVTRKGASRVEIREVLDVGLGQHSRHFSELNQLSQ